MVGCYIRVSTLGQKDNYSVETQRERGIAFAIRSSETYELFDEAKSGKNLERPEFLRLLKAVEEKKITKVWVIEASRLTRDVEDAQTIKKILKKNKVELFVNDQHVDLSTSESILSYDITAAVSSYERSKIIDRVTRSRRKQIDEGSQAYCSLLGYDFTFGADGKKIWHINEKEAEIIRHAFAWYQQGLTYYQIASRLIDAGYKSKRGGLFNRDNVSTMLNRPEYFGKTRNTKREIIDSKIYPPILDANLMGVLKDHTIHRERINKHLRQSVAELAGVGRCRKCGAAYYLNRNRFYVNKKGERIVYKSYYGHFGSAVAHVKCTNMPKYIPKESLERFVEFCYTAILRNKFELKNLIEAKEKEIFFAEKDLISRLADIEQQIAGIDTRRKRLIAGIASGLYTQDDIQDSMLDLNKRKEETQESYSRMKHDLEVKRGDVESIIRSFADRGIDDFEKANEDVRRSILVTVIESLGFEDGWVYLKFITGREFNAPLKHLDAYMKAIKDVGDKEPFSENRIRWEELK